MSASGFWCYSKAFRDGCLVLKPDEVGIYFLVCTLLYETESGRLRDDDETIAKMLGGRDVRVWRRIRARLVELGKLKSSDGWLSQPRATEEIEKRNRLSDVRAAAGETGGKRSGESRRRRRSGGLPADFCDTSGELPRNVSRTSNVKPLCAMEAAEAIASIPSPVPKDSTTTPPPARAGARGLMDVLDAEFEDADPAAAAHDADTPSPPDRAWTTRELIDRCVAAAGPGLTRDRAQLETTIASVARAIGAGCSLGEDILPVIAARTKRARAGSIVTFAYFEAAWFENRDRRLAPRPPAPEPVHALDRPDDDARTRAAGEGHAILARAATAARDRRGAGGLVGAAMRSQARRLRDEAGRTAADGEADLLDVA